MMLKPWAIRFTLFTGVVLTATGVHAQSNSCIAGTVKDATGSVLPGVTVEVSSPALIEKVRTIVTNSTEQYKVDLQPRIYTVTLRSRASLPSGGRESN